MSRNRRTVNWIVAFLVVLVAAIAYGIITGRVDTAGAQVPEPLDPVTRWIAEHPEQPQPALAVLAPDAETFIAVTSTCQQIWYTWDDISLSKVPIFSQDGSVLVSCADGNSFSDTVILEHNYNDMVTYISNLPWYRHYFAKGICHIFAAVPYVVPPDMQTVWWRHLDANPGWQCQTLDMPIIMHYEPRTYEPCEEGLRRRTNAEPCEPYPSP